MGSSESKTSASKRQSEGYVANQMVSVRDSCESDFLECDCNRPRDASRTLGESFPERKESFNPYPERFQRGFAFKNFENNESKLNISFS